VALNEALGNATAGRVEFRESDDQARAPAWRSLHRGVARWHVTRPSIRCPRKGGGRAHRPDHRVERQPGLDLADLVLTLPVKDRATANRRYTARSSPVW